MNFQFVPKSKLRSLEAEAEVTLGTLLSENTKPPLASAGGSQDSGWQRVRSGRLCPEQTCVGSGSSRGSSWAVVHVVWDGLSTGPLRGMLCPVRLSKARGHRPRHSQAQGSGLPPKDALLIWSDNVVHGPQQRLETRPGSYIHTSYYGGESGDRLY